MLGVDLLKNESGLNSKSKPKRILVLDDDSILRMVAQPLLTEMGFEVLLMEDGLHDDRFFAKLKIDAAIVDLGLPGVQWPRSHSKIAGDANMESGCRYSLSRLRQI